MMDAIRRNTIPLIIATALFMENLDATVLATSLPAIAKDLGASPIHLKLAVTTYLLALAVFIPASGWVADRYGTRKVFRAAMAVFALGSIGCAMSEGLASLVAARVLQGVGGAMMMPVGRLVILRAVPKTEIVSAMAWLTVPALLGPVLGPPLGGFITTYFDWRWIFWINIPVALFGMWLVTRYIPDIREPANQRFDLFGFLLVGPGLAMFLTGVTIAGLDLLPRLLVAALIVAGALLLGLYVRHALRTDAPPIDLRLLALPTFRASLLGGMLFRIGLGAGPFLLPLLFQLGFGLTPFQSGLLIFATGVGAIFMKTQASRILRAYGFRRVLVWNAVIAGAFSLVPAFYTPATPYLLIAGLFFAGGLSRSLQFTSINSVGYADVPPEKLSRATSFGAVLQELSGSIGVSIAALGLEGMQAWLGEDGITLGLFPPVFLLVAAISAASALVFMRMPRDSGRELLFRAPDPRRDAPETGEGHL